ncbi:MULTISPECIES: mechanosensitive ion channel domain-containing protein [Pandoraea]|uniref:mechanosensitive ion channel family protein n=1 Tax=Pandoraea TaxID=93217 RepID=UPI001F5C47DF|nr:MULTISPECIES: mechanosensitive ion channel domain-containing protein [Pandoraea]MCI3208159.1 mechanosensitive ion channel protein [Pandoraea sp. LA3]MDN4586188.1 mechanosensitive ion channel protein [Pandoraea capi]
MRIRMGLLQVLVVCGIGVTLAWPVIAATSEDSPSSGAAVSVDGTQSAETAAAPASASDPQDGVELRFMDRPVVTFRGVLGGATPDVRAARARSVLDSLSGRVFDSPVDVLHASLGGVSGVAFRLQDRILFALTADDLAPGDPRSLDAVAADVQKNLQVAFAARRQQLHWPTILRGIALSALGAVVLVILVITVGRTRARLEAWLQGALEKRVLKRTARTFDWTGSAFHLVHQIVQIGAVCVALALAYLYLIFMLMQFPASQPMAGRMSDFLWSLVDKFGLGVAGAIPGILTVIVIFLLTRALQSLVNNIFDAVQNGRLTIPGMHPETAGATRRVVSVVVWGLALTFAYPYMPGAQSDVFKGLSVLLGLMVTLGSSGIVNQLMSGMIVIYSRSLKKGDLVSIGDATGVVVGVDALSVKLVNMAQEELTIPNAVVVASTVRNFSAKGHGGGVAISTTLTIGYDTPWRQVHAMLIEAALQTPQVVAQPAPYVLQRALSDFYVEYEIFATLRDPSTRFAAISALHEGIQDVFNRYGVQIMSPHFEEQPHSPLTIRPEHWYPAPAQAPEDGTVPSASAQGSPPSPASGAGHAR